MGMRGAAAKKVGYLTFSYSFLLVSSSRYVEQELQAVLHARPDIIERLGFLSLLLP